MPPRSTNDAPSGARAIRAIAPRIRWWRTASASGSPRAAAAALICSIAGSTHEPSHGSPSSDRFEVRDQVREIGLRQLRGPPVEIAAAARRGEPFGQRAGAAVVHERRARADADEARHLELLAGAHVHELVVC